MMERTISAARAAECGVIAGLLLRPGTRIERIDAIDVDPMSDLVQGVHLHVSAVEDIPSDVPFPEHSLLHAAGDCWQEVWLAWPETDASGMSRMSATRTV